MHTQLPASSGLTQYYLQSASAKSKTTMNDANNYTAFVALDWGDKKHAFALQMTPGDKIESGEIEASPEGLHAWLEAFALRCKAQPVALAVEAGHSGLLPVLVNYGWLTVYPVHTATSARFRTALIPSGAKDDVPDAQMLLTLLLRHRDRLSPLRLDTAQTRKLSALVTARRDAVDRRTQTLSQLRSVLKSYYPQVLELIGEDLGSPLALDWFERWPQLKDLLRARPSTVRTFYHKHNVRSPEVIERRLARIAQARPLSEEPALIEPCILQVRMLVELVRVYQGHIKGFDQHIAEAFTTHPSASLFQQLPGAGPVLAPRLLVAFGDQPERYPDPASLQKYAGIAPVREKSGGHCWTHWRRSAPRFLRQSFVEWAAQSIFHSLWAKAYYYQQKQTGRKKHHAIIRSLAFKWIRILWRCWKKREAYDETRYLAALKTRGSPLAALLQSNPSPT